MNELGILFQPSMALAIAQDRKTKTRRVITLPKWAKGWAKEHAIQRDEFGLAMVFNPQSGHDVRLRCPYAKIVGLCENDWRPRYQTGHTARVLTTWAVPADLDMLKPTEISLGYGIWWDASQGPKPAWAGKSRPGRFAPLGLRHNFPAIQILKVTVERLQDITEEDAVAEGFSADEQETWWQGYYDGTQESGGDLMHTQFIGPEPPEWMVEPHKMNHQGLQTTALERFKNLLAVINAKRGYGWDVNPWLWGVEFKRIAG